MTNMHDNEAYQKYPWLIFRLLHSNYAINTRYVSAVLEVSEIVKVVDAPDYIEGLIQVRDEVLSLIHTAKLFLPKESHPKPILAILLNYEDHHFAFGIDAIIGVEEIALISKSSDFNKGSMKSQYLYGVGKSLLDDQQAVILLLDDDYLVQSVSKVCD